MKANTYNIKHISYNNKEEYRFYNLPVAATSGSSNEKPKYIIVDGKEVNAATGQERTYESIEHSRTSSLNRTRQKIYDYILSNDWTDGYFITFTFNPSLVDSFNYDDCYNRIRQLIKNIRKTNPDIQYLFIPEQHKSKRWHFHALISNCPNLNMIDTGKKAKGMKIYNINTRTFKYGYTAATKIQDIEKLCTYMTKHITTDLIDATKGKHRYIYSNNLRLPEIRTYMVSAEDLEIEKEITLSDSRPVSVRKYKERCNTITYINIRKE